MEPIFATSYKRRVKENDGYGKSFKEYTVYHPIIEKLFETDEDLPEHVVTAHNMTLTLESKCREQSKSILIHQYLLQLI